MANTPPLSASSLVQILQENQIVDGERLARLLEGTPEAVREHPSAQALAQIMVQQELLTSYQASLLLQGKSRTLLIAKKYRILDRLGVGGMGQVYLCEHINMKRLVAMKVLPHKQARQAGVVERFLREAQAVAALKHPNIVQAYDVDKEAGIYFLVMEYIDGINLEKLIQRRGPLDGVRAAHYIAHAADGLQHAWERGLVHRDIKPSNLLLDRAGTIKILDLGLARFFEGPEGGSITERFNSRAVIGTADFISPEQALNSHAVDIRADIYSLGCTFYYLLVGKPPYHDANVTQKLLFHQMREPTAIQDYRDDVDAALVDVVRRMMAKKPEDRYQTPADIIESLAPWLRVPIDPPTPEEIPALSLAGVSDASKMLSTPTYQGPLTSAWSRSSTSLDNASRDTGRTNKSTLLRSVIDDGEETEESPGSVRKKLLIGGVFVLMVIAGIVLAAVKPWRSDRTPQRPSEDVRIIDGSRPGDPSKPRDPPPRIPLTPGFVEVRLDPHWPRPVVKTTGVRASPTDLLFFLGSEFRVPIPDDIAMFQVMRKDLYPAKPSPGSTCDAILPYGLACNADGQVPNTLLTIDGRFQPRPLAFNSRDFFITQNFVGVKPEQNALVQNEATLPPGITSINALVSEPWNISAAVGGSRLLVNSGVILVTGVCQNRKPVLGAGVHPLTIDFHQRTGYMTFALEREVAKGTPQLRDYTIRARLTGFNRDPLVLSGYPNTNVRLESVDKELAGNEMPRLVIQGRPASGIDRPFQVTFTEDRQLGKSKGGITLNEAHLIYAGSASLSIDRPLQIPPQQSGRLSLRGAKSQLRWTGKISGGKLIKVGAGTLFLTRGDNDYAGGTEITGGTLSLQAEGTTPAGRGNILVAPNAILTGTALVPGDVTVRPGATFQPGSDTGKPMLLRGKLTLQSGPIKSKDKTTERTATWSARVASADACCCIFEGSSPLDLGKATLRLQLIGSYKPDPAHVSCLILNRSNQPIVEGFSNLPSGSRVTTVDGLWSARISYSGNVANQSPEGGFDVVLFDWQPMPKKKKARVMGEGYGATA